MDIILDCPEGKKCEHIVDNQLHRCRAYVEIAMIDPQTGAETRERKCSVYEWQPILLLEIARTNRGQTAAIESFRNDTMLQALPMIHRVDRSRQLLDK
jgi:hypothetical protein